MICTLYKNSEISTNKWSGGTTKQLYIFPLNADYKAGNFDFRISSATVDLERSNFTPLPGIKRQIMSLDRSIELIHNGEQRHCLSPLSVHTFSGDDSTECIGQCTDFNLMTIGNTKTEMSHWLVSRDNSVCFIPHSDIKKVFLYLYQGQAQIETNSGIVEMQKGDFAALEEMESEEIKISSPSEAIIASVYFHG